MRELKFRAWCKEYGLPGFMIIPNDFSNDEFITFDGNPIEVVAQEGWFETNGLKYELMQYTGLKDKNGKEIYEGDIVIGESYGDYPLIIKWDYERTGFYCHDPIGDDDDHLNMFEMRTGEVIGNIYETPELIKP
jgi:uncharacterized phage protein (TIGR01671 family)